MKLLTLKNLAGLIVLAGILATASCGYDEYVVATGRHHRLQRPDIRHQRPTPVRVRHYTPPQRVVPHQPTPRQRSTSFGATFQFGGSRPNSAVTQHVGRPSGRPDLRGRSGDRDSGRRRR